MHRDPNLSACPDLSGPPELIEARYDLCPIGADYTALRALMTFGVARLLVQLARGREVRQVKIVPGPAAPSWHPAQVAPFASLGDAYRPSRVTIGDEWLAQHAPAAWARHRLTGDPFGYQISHAELEAMRLAARGIAP